MSFKLFLYYCAVGGAWAAWFAWALGSVVAPAGVIGGALLRGFVPGMLIAFALGLVDVLWNSSRRRIDEVAPPVVVAALLGGIGGLLGAGVGEYLHNAQRSIFFVVAGWELTGLLIGAAVGMYDVLTRFLRGVDLAGARRRLFQALLGGALGGLLGGVLFVVLRRELVRLFEKPEEDMISGSAVGFAALGLSVGLFIGLAQVMLRGAWLRVDAGYRAGRELILSRRETTIGRSESCDLGLYGDPGVARVHARIVHDGRRYLLEDAGTTGGTFVNEERIRGPRLLRSGDTIRLGNSVVQFHERSKPGAGA
jgi:hypothetical protein